MTTATDENRGAVSQPITAHDGTPPASAPHHQSGPPGIGTHDEPGFRLEDMSLPLCLVDPDGMIQWANTAFWDVAQTADGQAAPGVHFDALVARADCHQLAASLAHPVEVKFVDADQRGRRHELRVMARGVARLPESAPPVLMAAIDVEEWRADAELESMLRAELGHRLRNLVSVISALVNDTIGGRQDAVAVARLLDRLRSLQTAGYVGNEVFDTDSYVGRIARRILDRFHDPADRRVVMDSEDVAISRRWGNTLALILHELATNCIKHGSLSTRSGMVMMRWCTIAHLDRTVLHIEWREVGGPPAHTPSRLGQGLTFVQNVLARAKDAHVAFRFAPTGFTCQLDLPVEHRRH